MYPMIDTGGDTHSEIAMAAMRAGKAVASEVGGAYTLSECWKLVDCYEETKTPIMFMENCVYGRDEMMVFHMTEEGVLGEIVHCEGGYKHDLREEIFFGKENRHYRLENYIHRNTENYPAHELEPIAKVLHINRGKHFTDLGYHPAQSLFPRLYRARHQEDVYGGQCFYFPGWG